MWEWVTTTLWALLFGSIAALFVVIVGAALWIFRGFITRDWTVTRELPINNEKVDPNDHGHQNNSTGKLIRHTHLGGDVLHAHDQRLGIIEYPNAS